MTTKFLQIQVETMLSSGRDALLKRMSNNRWSDFKTNNSGISDLWITAYVLANCGTLFLEENSEILDNFSTDFIQRNGTIGFNDNVPNDGDSTAFGILASLLRTNPEHIVYRKSLNFLKGHFEATNWKGSSTYRPDSGIAEFKSLDISKFDGWCKTPAHDVSAVVALAGIQTTCSTKLFTAIEKWISTFDTETEIHAYWWVTDWYLYSWLSKFLAQNNLANNSNEVGKLVQYIQKIASRLDHTDDLQFNSPFESAHFIDSISNFFELGLITSKTFESHLNRSLVYLESAQESAGTWKSEAIMRISYPWDTTPWKSDYFVTTKSGRGGLLGDGGNLSTAAVLRGLISAKKQLLKS